MVHLLLLMSSYRRNGGIGKGLLNERALLINARTQYPSFLMSFRDSDIMITGLGKAN